jgi:hypothetical protein
VMVALYCVRPDDHARGLLPERVDQGVTDAAHAGRFVGAAGEHHSASGQSSAAADGATTGASGSAVAASVAAPGWPTTAMLLVAWAVANFRGASLGLYRIII